MPNLTDVGSIRALLHRHDFTFSKSLGQNFLVNPAVCPRMAEACAESHAEGVVEIGPGIGVLTQELAQRFRKVVCYELDSRLLPVLGETLAAYDNVCVRNEDVLKADIPALLAESFGGMRVSVCANLPYYITSPILMFLLENRFPFSNVTVMVQKEAADRICAPVGSRLAGALTAAVHYYAEPEKLFSVSRGSFLPAPNVDSTVIRLTVREKPAVEVADEARFFRLIAAAFAQRRKTAVNSISAGMGLSKQTVEDALLSLGFEKNVRAETFTLEDFAALDAALLRCAARE